MNHNGDYIMLHNMVADVWGRLIFIKTILVY